MTKLDISNILNDVVITTNDKVTLLESLSFIRENLYKKNQNLTDKSISNAIPEKYFKIIESIHTKTDSPAELDKLLSSFEKLITKIPIAHVTLGYDPTRYQITQIAMKLRKKLANNPIIAYSVNYSMGVGIQIDFNGQIYKRTLENITQ